MTNFPQYETVLLAIDNRIATVTLNRPEKLNALNARARSDLREVFGFIKTSPEVDVVIITGAGQKAFAAGTDIGELKALTTESGKEFSAKGQAVLDLIENLGKPVIAAINGYALGGGCEMALACHIRIAAENAKLGVPEVNLGLIPGYGGTQRLARLIGTGRAMELILTGKQIDAKEAERIGLVNMVVPRAELLPRAMELAHTIGRKGQLSIRMALKAVHVTQEANLTDGLQLEAALFGICCASEDAREGTAAFLEKRQPEFKNRKNA